MAISPFSAAVKEDIFSKNIESKKLEKFETEQKSISTMLKTLLNQ